MSTNLTAVTIGGGAAPAAETLVAPAHVTETATGVVADSSKIVPPAEKVERPAWLPEKFKTVEDFKKSYEELESRLGKPAEPAKPAITAADAAAKGVDLKALGAEYASTGALSEKSYTDLAAKGFDKATVDTYINGLKAEGEKIAGAMQEIAGGPEKLTNVLQWAQTNLTPAEAKAYNDLIDAGMVDAAKMTLAGIVGRYNAAVGTDPSLVAASPSLGTAGVVPFLSQQEVVDAMSARNNRGQKRYEVDPAYRAQVERRLSVSFN